MRLSAACVCPRRPSIDSLPKPNGTFLQNSWCGRGRVDEVGVRPAGPPRTTPGECSSQMSNSHKICCWTKSEGEEERKVCQHAQSVCNVLNSVLPPIKNKFVIQTKVWRPRLPEFLIQCTCTAHAQAARILVLNSKID